MRFITTTMALSFFMFLTYEVVAGTCVTKHAECVLIAKKSLFVNGQATKSGNGTSWDRAFKTIQEALDAVKKENDQSSWDTHHTIMVAEGTYSLTYAPQKKSRRHAIPKALITYENIPSDITILGGFKVGDECLEDHKPSAHTILLGSKNGSKAIMATFQKQARTAKLTINGFTIKDFGSLEDSFEGGAMYISGGTLVMKNIDFQQNSAQNGGAIWMSTTTAMFENCTFTGNTAKSQGGALYIYNFQPKVVQPTFFNKCVFGGEGSNHNSAIKGGLVFSRKALSDGPKTPGVTFNECSIGENQSSFGPIIDDAVDMLDEEGKI